MRDRVDKRAPIIILSKEVEVGIDYFSKYIHDMVNNVTYRGVEITVTKHNIPVCKIVPVAPLRKE